MSLLDDVSIVVTPNGYKAGELYAVIPSNGDADMDVTRATDATRVDENGLVNYAEVIGGEEVTCGDFSCAVPTDYWTENGWTINGEASNDGVNTGNLNQDIGLQQDKTYLVEVTITNYNSGTLQVRLGLGATIDVGSSEDTFSLTLTSTSTNSLLRFYPKVGSLFNGSISNVSVKEVTRDNVPRIDYTGGGCPHILAEPQRTNLITYSEDFSNAIWQKQTGIVPTYNTTETLSPDGTYNATKFIGTGSTGVFKASIIVSGNISRSVYLKSVTGTTTATFKEPNTGTPSAISLTITNEWQRFEMIGDNGSSSQGLWIDDITSDGLYMWGAQLEAGSYATSYIPTSGSTVTRNQDIFTRDGIGSLIGSEGVLFVEMAALSNDGTNRGISLNDGTATNRLLLYFSSASNQIAVISTGFTGSIIYTLPDETLFNKIAVRYKANDITLWVDGASRGTPITSATIPTFTAFKFDSGSAASPFYGKVKQLQVYDTALTDTQLAALTS
jgi:hypothetical protein